MNKIITLAICFLTLTTVAQNFDWATPDGGYNEDRGFGIAADSNGNVYVTGFFRSTATFGSYTFTSVGVQDIFLVKYSPTGTVLWARQYGGQSNDYGHEVAVDAEGNCYLAGSYRGEVTFGSFTLQSTTFQDTEALLLKVDPNGNVLWARKGGGAGWDEARGVTVAGNQVYVTGVFSETATFGSTTVTTIGDSDMFVASYDTSGNLNWLSRGGGLKSEIGFDIDSDSAGNAYVSGYFQGGTTNFGPVSVTNGGNLYADVFVVKLDTSGTIQYLKQFGGGAGDYAFDVAAYGGTVYITGLIGGTVSFGTTTLSSQGSNDIYIAALDAATGSLLGAMRGRIG